MSNVFSQLLGSNFQSSPFASDSSIRTIEPHVDSR